MAIIGPVISRIAFFVAVLDREIGLFLDYALDIFDDDDGVIDHDTDRQHQR